MFIYIFVFVIVVFIRYLSCSSSSSVSLNFAIILPDFDLAIRISEIRWYFLLVNWAQFLLWSILCRYPVDGEC